MELFFSDDICDSRVRLDQEESTHCVRVLRHRAGDEISVIDGRGTLYRCALEIADARGAEARVLAAEPGFGAHPYHLTMAVCPTKNIDRYEWFVEKATEIGVDVIAPVIGERSERKVLKTERLRRLVLSATKQSLKAAMPEVAEPVTVRDFIAAAPADALKLICYCFDDVERIPITSLLRPAGSAPGKPVATHGLVNGGDPTVRLGGMSAEREVLQGSSPAAADVVFWAQNWRKGGLQPRRNEIIREQGFYNQTWCGCEFSRQPTTKNQ